MPLTVHNYFILSFCHVSLLILSLPLPFLCCNPYSLATILASSRSISLLQSTPYLANLPSSFPMCFNLPLHQVYHSVYPCLSTLLPLCSFFQVLTTKMIWRLKFCCLFYLERDVPPLLIYQLIRNCGNQLFTCMPEKRTELVKGFWSELKEKGVHFF